jgi:PAS domain S-box-containing protein
MLAGGERIGTLCVIDRVPRRLSAAQQEQLGELGAAVVQAIELRERVLLLRRTEEALSASDARFRTLSDALPVDVYHTHAAGPCTYTNASWQETTGMTLARSLGNGWAAASHPEDRAEAFLRWNDAAGRGARFAMHLRMQRPDGTVRMVDRKRATEALLTIRGSS